MWGNARHAMGVIHKLARQLKSKLQQLLNFALAKI